MGGQDQGHLLAHVSKSQRLPPRFAREHLKLRGKFFAESRGAQPKPFVREHNSMRMLPRPSHSVIIQGNPVSGLAALDIVKNLHAPRQHCKRRRMHF